MVDDLAFVVELQQPVGQLLDQVAQQLLAVLQRLLGAHLGRHVDALRQHVALLGVAEIVVKHRVHPKQLPSARRMRIRNICTLAVATDAIHPSITRA